MNDLFELKVIENELKSLRRELLRKDAQVRRLTAALADIADTDYRGNRSPESQRAQRQLEIEGFRP